MVQEDAGGGLVFWHPKGAIVRHLIEDSWKRIHMQNGYELLYTPHVAKADLWKISGHIDFYKENMYEQMKIEDEPYQLRPMNCPYHILIYKRKLNSYRDFPIRVAELGTVYRYEMSGSLHGLFRVRGFTQVNARFQLLSGQLLQILWGCRTPSFCLACIESFLLFSCVKTNVEVLTLNKTESWAYSVYDGQWQFIFSIFGGLF